MIRRTIAKRLRFEPGGEASEECLCIQPIPNSLDGKHSLAAPNQSGGAAVQKPFTHRIRDRRTIGRTDNERSRSHLQGCL